ncbi:MAG: enolase C-terminal domain-like protein [Nanoarchaeota archaeon]
MKIKRAEVYLLEIPFRKSFSHATSSRSKTGNLITKLTLENGIVGFGEGVPREYVTGENCVSSETVLSNFFIPVIRDVEFRSFEDCVRFLDDIREFRAGEVIFNSAKCSLELAVLDAFGKHFRRNISDVIDILKIERFSLTKKQKFSYVFSLDKEINWSLNKVLYAYGFRDFKFKIDSRRDYSQIEKFSKSIKDKISSFDVWLRADANGSLNESELDSVINELSKREVYYLEQPVARGKEKHLRSFKYQYIIMLDESLLNIEDAKRAIEEGYGDMFNIRVSKNGGIIPALRIIELARKNEILYQIGCMVGESGILSAVGRHFATMVPEALFYEGSYGKHLLKEDITKENMAFGFGAEVNPKKNPLGDFGLGINIDEKRLSRYSKKIKTIEL